VKTYLIRLGNINKVAFRTIQPEIVPRSNLLFYMQVSTLIEQVVEDESQMEGLMHNCSRVMVWQIDLESSYSSYPQKWIAKNNLDAIVHLPLV